MSGENFNWSQSALLALIHLGSSSLKMLRENTSHWRYVVSVPMFIDTTMYYRECLPTIRARTFTEVGKSWAWIWCFNTMLKDFVLSSHDTTHTIQKRAIWCMRGQRKNTPTLLISEPVTGSISQPLSATLLLLAAISHHPCRLHQHLWPRRIGYFGAYMLLYPCPVTISLGLLSRLTKIRLAVFSTYPTPFIATFYMAAKLRAVGSLFVT